MFEVNNYIVHNKYIENIESFFVFQNGVKKVFKQNDENFKALKNEIINILQQSRLMPAFGVSLHNETIVEMQKGNWLQINFLNEMNLVGLLLDSLLIKLEKTNGINLIRLHNGKYEGRCIYLDFDEEIDLNDIIKKYAE